MYQEFVIWNFEPDRCDERFGTVTSVDAPRSLPSPRHSLSWSARAATPSFAAASTDAWSVVPSGRSVASSVLPESVPLSALPASVPDGAVSSVAGVSPGVASSPAPDDVPSDGAVSSPVVVSSVGEVVGAVASGPVAPASSVGVPVAVGD